MDEIKFETWFPPDRQQSVIAQLQRRVGLTRIRAEYLVRLWVYLLVKQTIRQDPKAKPPIPDLVLLAEPEICTYREAANLFYGEKEQGSDRAAGLMIEKLAALGLIRKSFDGNATIIEILPIPELLNNPTTQSLAEVKP
ncbi:MAG: hypothetical protein WCD18_19755, partial [Thermosynechococcaceae cyanobacterium]